LSQFAQAIPKNKNNNEIEEYKLKMRRKKPFSMQKYCILLNNPMYKKSIFLNAKICYLIATFEYFRELKRFGIT
jgi:hypothetical protein